MNRGNWKKIMSILTATLGITFVITSLVAKKEKGKSQYKDESNQMNPLEGKKVVFIENDDEIENADGVRGHLEAVGESDYKVGFYEKYIKRGFDIILSFGGLVVLSPVLGAIALAIKIDDPGPVLFTQKRIGQNKRYFKLHKFRSMKMCTPHDVPTHQLENPEQYITRVGKFLRSHSLDELPQIWDIFIGNMSVIGPRPGLWNQDILTAERDKYNANDVKPGLTGWAQINGRDELEIPVKAKLDGEYVKHMGLLMDLKCFLGSVGVFAGDKSVVEGGTGEMKKKTGRLYTEGKSDAELIGNIGFGKAVNVDLSVKKKVLITGAGSYIGESFKKYAAEKYGDNFIIKDVDMLDSTWRDMDFSEFDIVYHVAGIAHADVGNVDEATKEKYYAVNTDLAVEVCKKAKAEGVKEFIFMSSMIIYGDSAPYGKNKIVNENTVPSAANFYGDSKLQADVAVRELASDEFKVIVLRPPMIYGKGSKGNYPTLAKFAKKLPVFPDVDNQRSMLHIDNLCEFLCQIMLVEVTQDATVLIPQNSEWTKTSEMVKEIANVYNKKIVISKMLKPCVKIMGTVPGKSGGLVNKAFGNNCYTYNISTYEGIRYQKLNLIESIKKTEGVFVDTKKNRILELVKEKDISNVDINVFIIGLRGYTQNYGGWEAFAHGLLDNWKNQNIHFYAYEKVDDITKEEVVNVNGITCIRVYEKDNGSSTMMKYDKHCTDITYELVKKYSINNPVMFHLGVRIGPYLWINKKKIRNLGIKMIENPAGAEWRRTKWNKLVQIYLWISAWLMAKSTDCMACDNEGIRELYDRMLIGKKPKLEYVAYGVDSAEKVDKEIPDKVEKYFEKWNIKQDEYYLILGRFIPENNYKMMFDGFMQSETKRKLMVICNYETELPKFYEYIKETTCFEKDNRIIMAGTLYDKDILHYIRQYAHGYIHGHSVGGTNPGLLEAMSETDINILYNVNFNKNVGGDAAYYFSTEEELTARINYVDAMKNSEKTHMGILAKQRMLDKYSWEFIVKEYNRIFYELVEK